MNPSEFEVDTREIWAKTDPYHPLWCHMLDVAAVCEWLVRGFGAPDGIPSVWVMYLAALHDICKADPEFQIFDESQTDVLREMGLPMPSRKGKFRHESRSGRRVCEQLCGEKYGWGKYAACLASSVLQGHHGNFEPRQCADDSVGYAQWKEIRDGFADMIADVLGLDAVPFAPRDFTHQDSTGVKLVSIIVLSDWFASKEELFRYPILDTNATPRDYWRQARVEAERAGRAL